MTDISITAASVIAGSSAKTISGTLGETITAGQAVYRDSSTRKFKKADANGASEMIRKAIGIALNGGADGQPGEVLTEGDITIGGTLTAGTAYYLSDTPGGICPVADIGSGEYVVLLGLAKSTTVLTVNIQYPAVSL
jgi:hypothetical protein